MAGWLDEPATRPPNVDGRMDYSIHSRQPQSPVEDDRARRDNLNLSRNECHHPRHLSHIELSSSKETNKEEGTYDDLIHSQSQLEWPSCQIRMWDSLPSSMMECHRV